MRNVDMPLPLL